jgi:hypothetical protein
MSIRSLTVATFKEKQRNLKRKKQWMQESFCLGLTFSISLPGIRNGENFLFFSPSSSFLGDLLFCEKLNMELSINSM